MFNEKIRVVIATAYLFIVCALLVTTRVVGAEDDCAQGTWNVMRVTQHAVVCVIE